MPNCIVVSPSLTFGSWTWFEDILLTSPAHISWTIIAYGQPPEITQPNVRFISVKGFEYVRAGRIMSRSSLIWLNLLYLLPLAVIAWYTCLRRQRNIDIVIGNGIAATILLIPCSWMGQTKTWLAYHSFISHLGRLPKTIIRVLLQGCAGAITNSNSSRNDLKSVIANRPIITVDHWAYDIFFTGTLSKKQAPRIPLNILYVGRTDVEKFGQCRRVCNLLCTKGLARLTVIGSKPTNIENDHSNIVYLGYVRSRETLLTYYQWADLTWAPADIDYVSRPGIEALASGCPLIISDIPSVAGKCNGLTRIPTSIIPVFAGWVVDGSDDTQVTALLEGLARQMDPITDQLKCREYAKLYHSTKNIHHLLEALFDCD